MSTAAHEPRRAGSRRAESSTGNKVTPRRNTPETSEPDGLQYDSDELPVLIRLPNLRELGAVEKPPASPTQKQRHRIGRASADTQSTSPSEVSKVAKKPIPSQSSRDKRLVLGGIVGGILVVVTLFLFNANSSKPPADQDGWASEAAGLEAPTQGLDITFATENEPPPLYDETSDIETAYFESGDLEIAPPSFPIRTMPAPEQSETAGLPGTYVPVDGWPPEEAMGLQLSADRAPADLWPGESMSLEQGCFECPPADSSGQTDYQSSRYPSETESFRMGKLNADRPPAADGDRGSILDGNIEIPDTTSIR